MKTFNPVTLCNNAYRLVVFVLLIMFLPHYIQAQTQLSFTGTPVRSGTAGAVNTTYTYNNIGSIGSSTIKGVIKITAISGGAILYTIDEANGGAAAAWQPVINGPNTANGNCWGITFQVSFFDAATSMPLTLSTIRAHGVDIDGDNGNLREYNEPYDLSSYTVENPTNLTVTNTASGGFHFRSPKTSYGGISLTQTNVAATWYYSNIHSITIKIGSCCVGGSCSATGPGTRQSSINFFDAVAYNVGATVLPVNFSRITGQNKGAENTIRWQVADEVNVVQYVIEKSAISDGGFVEAGKVGANQGEHYAFVDKYISSVLYYRLKAIDKDGKFKYSHTIRVSQQKKDEGFKLVSNTSSGTVQFDLTLDNNEEITTRVIDQLGATIHLQKLQAGKGTNRYVLDNIQYSSKGLYILHVTTGSGKRWVRKWMKSER